MDDLIKRDDAPERIWTASTNGKCHVGFDTPSLDYKNEYIRADLADPAAIREAALREAAALCDRYPYVEGVRTALIDLIGETK